MGQIRGDVNIIWLQPLLNAAAFWLQPAVMNVDVSPNYASGTQCTREWKPMEGSKCIFFNMKQRWKRDLREHLEGETSKLTGCSPQNAFLHTQKGNGASNISILIKDRLL